MKQIAVATGQDLREMFSAGAAWLEKGAPDIDAINVFPVPDGDTGTNMVLTMRSTMEEAFRAPDRSASAVIKAMAYGALMGARGNSGVILSQILRGLAKGLEGKESFTANDLAQALTVASQTAYAGLSRPVEGTILTVIRDVAKAAEAAAKENPEDLAAVVEALVNAAKESVAETPLLLPVLREAGVVDAGGQGLYNLLEGVSRYLKGETDATPFRKPQIIASTVPLIPKVISLTAEVEEPYGYCTEFLIEGQRLSPDRIRKRLEVKGQSLIVVGDESNVRVHIHTFDPGVVLRYATSLGVLHQVKVQNMDDQHREYLGMQKERLPAMDVAVVAVALGEGMKEVFRSLGTVAIVSGGQTMNPSVRELLQAVESVPSNKVILLPNNKNIILTASQVGPLTSKQVTVVPTKTMPQGIAALLSFGYEKALEENAQAMGEAATSVKTVEITRAVRTTQIKGLPIKKGQVIAVVDDEDLVAAGDEMAAVIFQALDKVGVETIEVMTLYYGAGTKPEEAEAIAQEIGNKYPGKQMELISGGQPHYDFIISLE